MVLARRLASQIYNCKDNNGNNNYITTLSELKPKQFPLFFEIFIKQGLRNKFLLQDGFKVNKYNLFLQKYINYLSDINIHYIKDI